MGYGFKVDVRGEYAAFNRPEFKVERVSYDVITPSAARGLLEAVYYKPAIRYVIDAIHVYNEPKFMNIRRNEVSEKISANNMNALMKKQSNGKRYMVTTQMIQQRAAMILKDVHYIIEAHFEMTGIASDHEDESEKKHYNILLRRLRKGQCFHMPYLGCREFPATVSLVEGDIPISTLQGERDLGYMLYDMDYDKEEITPTFFRATMDQGVIDLRDIRIVR